MKVKYFEDTDTLYVELSDFAITETKELNEKTYIDVDADRKVIGLTVEYAKQLLANSTF